MNWIRNNPAVAIFGGLVGLGILAFLAFGVFGIQTKFFDDEVAEDGPVFDSGAVSDNPSDVVDEALTDEIEERAGELIAKVDEMGGAARAVDLGFVQDEIMEAAYTHQKLVESKERIVVGMNEYIVEEPPPSGLLKVDPLVGEQQTERLAQLKAQRDDERVQASLKAVRAACEGDDNVMPHIIEAVRAYATLGEICGVMREVFGEYQQNISL